MTQEEYDAMIREIAASSNLSEVALQAMCECALARLDYNHVNKNDVIRETMVYVQGWVDCFGSAQALADSREAT